MTIVGKILVFLNLVFSLVVGAFAVMDYTARTHWADYAGKLKSQNDTLRASSDTYKKENDRLLQAQADLTAKLLADGGRVAPEVKGLPDVQRIGEALITVLQNRNTLIDRLTTALNTLRDEKKKADDLIARLRTTEEAYKTLVNSRQSDSGVSRQQLKDEMDKNFKLVQETNEMRDTMVTAQIQSRTLKERNTQLEDALRKAQTDLAQAKTLGARTSGVAGVNPPPENIEGLVRLAEGNLVTISLGSDAGLARGQTMEVFRFGQNPKYVGRIRIVEVNQTSSIGTATGKLLAPIQVGDRVASRIVGGY
jgi:hypothetical protein